MPPVPETPMLVRAALGDDAAVRGCLARFGGLVWALARRLSPSPADAEDATQEIFLDLWRHGARYDPARGSEEVFVAMLARRRLIDRRRTVLRRPATLPLAEAAGASVQGDAERCAEAGLAVRAMAGLRVEQREVLRLSVTQGLTHEEIAAQTGMPLGTVKAHTRRGLQRIRAALLGEVNEVVSPEDER
ncbi:MAG: sigma-70 family RNA polymerase sigma factor [Anaeromyxobacter sp.]|nr:sigma-70 family RNA polymerase sigma factor [Anaeromyxobacter sp.]